MGTSMASPHVAGVAALVVGEGVTDPDAVEKILKDTARKPAQPEVLGRPVRRRHHRRAGRGQEGARARAAAGSSPRPAHGRRGRRVARAAAASASSSAGATSRGVVRRRVGPVLPAVHRAGAVVGAGHLHADARPAVVGPLAARPGRSRQRAVLQRADPARAARGRLRRAEAARAARRPRGRRRGAPRVLRGGAADVGARAGGVRDRDAWLALNALRLPRRSRALALRRYAARDPSSHHDRARAVQVLVRAHDGVPRRHEGAPARAQLHGRRRARRGARATCRR